MTKKSKSSGYRRRSKASSRVPYHAKQGLSSLLGRISRDGEDDVAELAAGYHTTLNKVCWEEYQVVKRGSEYHGCREEIEIFGIHAP